MKLSLSLPQALACLFFFSTSPTGAQNNAEETNENATAAPTVVDCSALDGCLSCMSERRCFWATDGRCLSDCSNITERHVDCYAHWATSNSAGGSFFTSADSLCSTQEQDLDSIDLCRDIEDCSACRCTGFDYTQGLQSSSCSLFEEGGYRSAVSLDPDGEPSARYCRDDDSPEAICHFANADCNTCVSTQADENMTCTWTGGFCSDWCFYSDKENCFSFALYPNLTVDEICQISNLLDQDIALCEEGNWEDGMTCEVCTSRITSDGTSCQSWSENVCIVGIGEHTGVETCEAPTSNVTNVPENVTEVPETTIETNGADDGDGTVDDATSREVETEREETPVNSVSGPVYIQSMFGSSVVSILILMLGLY